MIESASGPRFVWRDKVVHELCRRCLWEGSERRVDAGETSGYEVKG